MKKEYPAMPRYIVVDTKTGETVDYLGSQGKTPHYRGKIFYMGRTARRLCMIAAYAALLACVSMAAKWAAAHIPFLDGLIGDILLGCVIVFVAMIVATEWFEIDERMEAFDAVAARAEHWEDAYFELAKQVEKENRQA